METVGKSLSMGAVAGQTKIVEELENKAKQIRETISDSAIGNDGILDAKYHELKLGKEYMALQAQSTGTQTKSALETDIYNHLYTFFSRYYDSGDFFSKRRYSRKEKYAIPYNGEEVYLYWANSD